MNRLLTPILVLIVLLTTPIAASADERVVSTALGSDGQLISLLSGTYGELFPEGSEAQPDITVLALRRTLADGERLLEVVPATLDPDTEEAAELVVEPVSGVSYIFWQSWTNQIHSRFRVSSHDGESWGDPIDVSGSVFAGRKFPAFAVTRDSFADIETVEGSPVHRTVLHILWSEEGVGDQWDTRYAPLVLEDGEYIGEHPVLVLNDLLDRDGDGAAESGHQIAPVIRSHGNENSVVAAFLDQHTALVTAVEIRFGAGELSILGSSVATEVERVASTTDVSDPKGVDNLVQAVRARILGYEDQVRPEILAPLATDLEQHLRGRVPNGPADVGSIKGDARAHLIDVGFRLTDRRVRKVAGGARAHLIDVGVDNEGPRRRHRHDVRSAVASNRRIPNLSSTPEVLLSPQGTKLMLVWSDKDRVQYQESREDGGWSAVQQIRLTDQIDRAKAVAILQARVDQH